jgi:hypothetical protein
MIEAGTLVTFTTPYDQYREYGGRKAKVLGEVDHTLTDPDDVGPLYNIQFEDGTIIEAWPEEINPNERTDTWHSQ